MKQGDILFEETIAPAGRERVALFSEATEDPNPIHVNDDFAHKAGFRTVLQQGPMTTAQFARLLGKAVGDDAVKSARRHLHGAGLSRRHADPARRGDRTRSADALHADGGQERRHADGEGHRRSERAGMTRRHPNKVMVAGGAVGPFGRHIARSLADIANEAIVEAVAAARVARSDIAAAFVGNAFGGAITDQELILAQTLLAPAGISGIPMRTIKNACSSGADAVHLGWSAIAYGQYDCVLVLGAEKLTHDDKLRAFKALATATDHAPLSATAARSLSTSMPTVPRAYMEQYGATPEHFAKVAAKNRDHARLNDRAAERRPLTVAEVLADRVVVPPLTRAMCGGIADGAACVILVSEDFAKRRGINGMSEIVASSVVSGIPGGSADGNATHRAARGAYEASGIDARDIAVAEVHDPTSPQELFDIEDLLFCGRGEAIRLLAGRRHRDRRPHPGEHQRRARPAAVIRSAPPASRRSSKSTSNSPAAPAPRQVAGAKVGLAQMAGGLARQRFRHCQCASVVGLRPRMSYRNPRSLRSLHQQRVVSILVERDAGGEKPAHRRRALHRAGCERARCGRCGDSRPRRRGRPGIAPGRASARKRSTSSPTVCWRKPTASPGSRPPIPARPGARARPIS